MALIIIKNTAMIVVLFLKSFVGLFNLPVNIFAELLLLWIFGSFLKLGMSKQFYMLSTPQNLHMTLLKTNKNKLCTSFIF